MKLLVSLLFSILMVLSCVSESTHGHFDHEDYQSNHCLICKKVASNGECLPASEVIYNFKNFFVDESSSLITSNESTDQNLYLKQIQSRAPPV